jgi:hypothetical protein
MDSFHRLQLIARITYYLGWATAVCAGLAHFTIGTAMFRSIDLTKRNLFEASVFLFLVTAASELRALVLAESNGAPRVATKQAA